MERGQHDTPHPLEHDDEHRRQGIAKLATYLAFEHNMQDADNGKCTREEAIERVRALQPLLREGVEG